MYILLSFLFRFYNIFYIFFKKIFNNSININEPFYILLKKKLFIFYKLYLPNIKAEGKKKKK